MTHDQLVRAASCDFLTDALNRGATERYAAYLLSHMAPGEICVLYMIDLDNFKQVNDALGHQQGDEVLVRTAEAISSALEPPDLLGRLGGDEFVVLATGVMTSEDAECMAAELAEAIQMTVGVSEHIDISASIGVVVGHNSLPFEVLYELADQALMEAKRKGKSCYHLIYADADNISTGLVEKNPVGVIQWQSLLEHINEGIILLGLGEQPRLLYASSGCTALFGQDCRKLTLADDALEVLAPSDASHLREAFTRCVEGEPPEEMTLRIVKEGHVHRWVQAKAALVPQKGGLSPVVVVILTDITQLKEQQRALHESEERIRIAFDQTAQTLWEVDISSHTFQVFDTEKQEYAQEDRYENMPNSMIDGGYIHPSSRRIFLAWAHDLLSGQPHGETTVVVRYRNTGFYGWAKMSYSMIFDEDNKPLKAIGVTEEIPSIFNEKTLFEQESALFDVLSECELETVAVNVTTGAFEKNAAATPERRAMVQYSAYWESKAAEALSEEDRCLLMRFTRQALEDAYAEGTSWIEEEYRCRTQDGAIRWMSAVANLVVEPVTRDLHAFMIWRDVNKRRRWELALPSRIERDSTSHLCTRKTAIDMMANALKKRGGSLATCAFALVVLNKVSAVREKAGGEAVGRLRFSAGRFFRILLDHECIVGQYDENHLMFFWPEALSAAHVKNLMTTTIATLRRTQSDSGVAGKITFTVGITVGTVGESSYDSFYERAVYVCDRFQNTDNDCVMVFEDYAEENRLLIDTDTTQEVVTASPEEGLRPLSADEKDALLTCYMELASGISSDKVMTGILGVIGSHYQAERVYQLALSKSSQMLRGVYEWNAEGKRSIIDQFMNLPLSRVAAMRVANEKRRPILLRGPSTWSSAQGEEWRFICVPILEQEQVAGFICVENPQRHYADTALLTALVPTALSSCRSGQSRQHGDEVAGLLGSASYFQMLEGITVDALSSLGAAYLEFHGLEEALRERASEADEPLLVYAAKILLKYFSHNEVFRISGRSFAIVCPDMTYEMFRIKCDRMQEQLDHQFPRSFSMGYTWSDEDISATKLMRHAETLMRYNSQVRFDTSDQDEDQREMRSLKIVRKAISEGRYLVHIQPKTSIATGEVMGGESLVRYCDPARGIIAPVEFIGRLERDHVIRELDFFVLDQTLRIMQGWKNNGKKLVPISVNFSRQTLLDRSALAAALAIHSRYDIPLELIEIEITETLGALERQTIVDAVESFQERGFRIALDDFGSDYSSIALLSSIKFDVVKFDKSIVQNFESNEVSRAIVKSMVSVCGVMGAQCIAEGVESEAQARALLEVGCAFAQGYFYNKPLPAEDFENKYL